LSRILLFVAKILAQRTVSFYDVDTGYHFNGQRQIHRAPTFSNRQTEIKEKRSLLYRKVDGNVMTHHHTSKKSERYPAFSVLCDRPSIVLFFRWSIQGMAIIARPEISEGRPWIKIQNTICRQKYIA
jgi:hypothetical protein